MLTMSHVRSPGGNKNMPTYARDCILLNFQVQVSTCSVKQKISLKSIANYI